MALKSPLKRFSEWTKRSGLFESNHEKIKGKWLLSEFYVDKTEGLLHLKEKDIAKEKFLMIHSFLDNNEVLVTSNLPVTLFDSFSEGEWSISRNYITFIDPKEFRNNIEFQFAFEKGNLKLLKKDSQGKIEFFGFFRRMEEKK